MLERRAGLPPLWACLSAATALLAAGGSIVALLRPEQIYGQETSTLFDAAIAQDLVNLFLVAPLMLILAVGAFRGSLLSSLCLAGLLGFTAYNYALYAFSIHFGPLFLAWVAVLGSAVFALGGTLASLITGVGMTNLVGARRMRLPGWFLMCAAGVFALLWLSEIVPDLVAGRPSTSASAWNVPTNPVHVLDLALFLPAVCVSGVFLLQRRRIGYASAPAALVFLALTCLPILVTPFVAQAHGQTPVWMIIAPIGFVAVATLLILWLVLHTIRTSVA
jgi:hypothetical protein